MEFWVVPNVAGLPTVTVDRLLQASFIGKGAMVRDDGITIASSNSGGDGTQQDFAAAGVIYDDLSFFDDGSDGFIIPVTVPAIQRVQLGFQCGWEGGTVGTRQARILKNGFSYDDNPGGVGMGGQIAPGFGINSDSPLSVTTLPVAVVAGDVFTVFVKQNSGGNLSVTDAVFAIWIVR